jgi:hypothetical protein
MNYIDMYKKLRGDQGWLRERMCEALLKLPTDEKTIRNLGKQTGLAANTINLFINHNKRVHVKSAQRMVEWLEKREEQLKGTDEL